MIIRIKRLLSDQRGQAFPLALIVLAMGSLFVGGFLSSAVTSLMTSEVYSDPIPENYAADAGIEDAIWGLQYGTLADDLDSSGGYVGYTLPETVNGYSVNVTLNGTAGLIASHDFNDNRLTGGTGWLSGWDHQGSTTITTKDGPYEGTHHMELRGANLYLRRSVDIFGKTDVRLQFWAKAVSLETGDTVSCLVSSNFTDWTPVRTWGSGESDGIYRFVDIDLSPYEMSSQFWISFVSGMDRNNDYFYIDDVKITGTGGSVIIQSAAGERTTTVKVGLMEGTVSVISWELD